MKNTILISALAVLAVAALITSSNLTAQDAPDDTPAKQQKIIRLEGQSSYMMRGDKRPDGADHGSALPALIANGWKIVEMSSTGTSSDSAKAFVLLEK